MGWAGGLGAMVMGTKGCTEGLEAVVTVPAVPQGCPKVRRILEIWASGQGVVSVHCFQSTVPAEAYTRESCLVEALGEQGRWGEMVLPRPPGPAAAPGIGSATAATPCIPLSQPMQESGGTQRGDAAHPGAHGGFGVPGCQRRIWAQSPRLLSPAGKAAWEWVLVEDTGLLPSLWGCGC